MADAKSPVVVFDIDDTLYPEFDYIRSGVRCGAVALGPSVDCDRFVETYASRFLAGQRDDLIQATAADPGIAIEPEHVKAFLGAYRAQTPAIALSATIRSGLSRLAERGVSLAAISDGDAKRQRRKVEALDLDVWLNPVILTGELGEGTRQKGSVTVRVDRTAFRSGTPIRVCRRQFGQGLHSSGAARLGHDPDFTSGTRSPRASSERDHRCDRRNRPYARRGKISWGNFISPALRTAGRLLRPPPKHRHGRMPLIADALTRHQPQDRRADDPRVEPQAVMVDVPDIEIEFLFP